MTVKEVAERMGVTIHTVRSWIYKKQLKAGWAMGEKSMQRVIKEADLQKFIDKRKGV